MFRTLLLTLMLLVPAKGYAWDWTSLLVAVLGGATLAIFWRTDREGRIAV
jgi:hypothetical protein